MGYFRVRPPAKRKDDQKGRDHSSDGMGSFMRIGRHELRLTILEGLQFGGWKLHVAFATPTKLRERAVLPAPAQRILDPWMKNTDTHSCSISTCLFGTAATFILPGEVCPYGYS